MLIKRSRIAFGLNNQIIPSIFDEVSMTDRVFFTRVSRQLEIAYAFSFTLPNDGIKDRLHLEVGVEMRFFCICRPLDSLTLSLHEETETRYETFERGIHDSAALEPFHFPKVTLRKHSMRVATTA